MIIIAAPWKRLKKAQPLPDVECSKAEAEQFFAGMWHGIALRFVMGAAITVLVMGVV